MSCELIGTCAVKELRVLQNNLGSAAEGFSPIDLRNMVCQSEGDEARAKDCPKFNERRPQLQKKVATDYLRYRGRLK